MKLRNNFLDSSAWWITIILLALLPFHAFLFTWFHSFFWQESWVIIVQAWKEIFVGILAFLAGLKFLKTRQLPKTRSFKISLAFVILAFLYAIFGSSELIQKILGLRTVIIFPVVFLAISFFQFEKQKIFQLKKIVLTSSALVIVFALAQKFFLPTDFLASFGYSTNVSSWLPGGNLPMYHLVGEGDTIRLQSTFAGPNQLAAYLLVIIPLAFSFLRDKKNWWKWLSAFIVLGGIIALFLTYSRSAWIGLIAILLALAITAWRKNLSRKLKTRFAVGGVIATLGLGLGIFGFVQPNFQEVFLRQASSSAHLTRSVEASKLVLQNPFGLGLGSTGGVSQRFDSENHTGITPENTYLGMALELGWLGGMLFLAILLTLLKELNTQKSPLFYSLLGIAVIALFLHPLEDMPTALTLFSLLGLGTHLTE